MRTQTTNGRLRKSLADQIDRLDAVIDSLGEGLNETVAAVVEQAVTVAVQAAVTEVLTNPELRRRLALDAPIAQPALNTRSPATPPKQEQQATWWQQVGGLVRVGWDWFSAKACQLWDGLSAVSQGCARALATTTLTAWQPAKALAIGVWQFVVLAWLLLCLVRTPLLIASGVGLVVGVACFWAGPMVASACSGFAGFAASLIAALARRLWADPENLTQQNN